MKTAEPVPPDKQIMWHDVGLSVFEPCGYGFYHEFGKGHFACKGLGA